jgi:hypothetical protein
MELILCEKPKVGRDTARLLGIKEQHQEYIVCKDGTVGSWGIGCLFLGLLHRSRAPTVQLLCRALTLLRLGKVMPIRRLVPRGTGKQPSLV